jgi:hypothetical protein
MRLPDAFDLKLGAVAAVWIICAYGIARCIAGH